MTMVAADDEPDEAAARVLQSELSELPGAGGPESENGPPQLDAPAGLAVWEARHAALEALLARAPQIADGLRAAADLVVTGRPRAVLDGLRTWLDESDALLREMSCLLGRTVDSLAHARELLVAQLAQARADEERMRRTREEELRREREAAARAVILDAAGKLSALGLDERAQALLAQHGIVGEPDHQDGADEPDGPDGAGHPSAVHTSAPALPDPAPGAGDPKTGDDPHGAAAPQPSSDGDGTDGGRLRRGGAVWVVAGLGVARPRRRIRQSRCGRVHRGRVPGA
ncbi:MAG TPA: hypothetical protein VNV66_04120, partial [Pilimelia sp.]|nr:hypothetical protein [Pilimelia sp.]